MPCFAVYAQDTVYIDEYIYDTIQVYDTVYKYDTIYKTNISNIDTNFTDSIKIDNGIIIDSITPNAIDSVYKTENDSIKDIKSADTIPTKNPIKVKNDKERFKNLSLGINTSLFYPNIRRNQFIKHDYSKLSYSFGAALLYDINKSQFELGASYSKFRISSNNTINNTIFDTTIISNITLINTTYTYDTLGYTSVITYDSVFSAFDSSWHYFIDTAIYTLYIDTVSIFDYDTTFTNDITSSQFDTIINSYSEYSYFEIPLIYRFSIYNGNKFGVKMGFGLISGFLYKSTLNYYASNNINLISYSREEFRSILFSLRLSTNISYNISNQTSISLEPYYCFALNPLLKTNTDIINSDRWGLNFCVIYRLGIKD